MSSTPQSAAPAAHAPPAACTPDDAHTLSGDSQAIESVFEHLFATYWSALVTFAERSGHSHDVARDIVQEVFLDLWDRRESIRLNDGIRGYLYAATRHRALNVVRHARVVQRSADAHAEAFIESSPGMGEPPRDIDAQLECDELASAVHQAIITLSARTREVFILRWYDRLSYEEIAHTLGISVRTVNSHLTAAISSLRKQLRHII